MGYEGLPFCGDLPRNNRDGERIGASVSCRELPRDGRNGERTWATVICNEVSMNIQK
jgi:hypothetical protein